MYERHASAITAYAQRRTDPATAEDVVGEVFLIAWRRLDEIPDDELAWLLGTARKVLANIRRSRRRQVAVQRRMADEAPLGHEQAPSRDWPMLRALARLSERDRETILLVAWDGLATAQAARVLGVRTRTFDARLYRARKRLAAVLGEEQSEAATLHPLIERRV